MIHSICYRVACENRTIVRSQSSECLRVKQKCDSVSIMSAVDRLQREAEDSVAGLLGCSRVGDGYLQAEQRHCVLMAVVDI